MDFSSITFIQIFLPTVLLLYFEVLLITKKSGKINDFIIAISSIVFCLFGGVKGFTVLLILIAINYYFGIVIDNNGGIVKNIATIIGISANVLVLAFYKYYGFFDKSTSLVVPLGLSFVIFQNIGYLADVRMQRCEGTRDFLAFSLFNISFFQISQGPIIRFDNFKKQLESKHPTNEKIVKGIRKFCFGLGKKIIIANVIAGFVNTVWSYDLNTLGFVSSWILVVGYTLQIYYDFSGYSDMAIGLGYILGFELKENFDYPYTSLSIGEFWNRWHISLGSWFKDYIYIPLGGNRKGTLRTCFNLLIVFIVTGIWHGATINYVIWGLMNGLFRIAESLFLGNILKKNKFKLLNWVYVIAVVIFGWIIFRANDLSEVETLINNMVNTSKMVGETRIVSLISFKLIASYVLGIVSIGFIQRFVKYLVSKNNNLVSALEVISTLTSIIVFTISLFMIINGSYSPSIYGEF